MESLNEIWSLVLETCESRMNETAYRVWISGIEPQELTDREITLLFSSTFKKNVTMERYDDTLKSAIEDTIGFSVDIKYVAADEEAEIVQVVKSNEFTFDNFIVGSSNKFAHAAAKAVALNPGGTNSDSMVCYNPLFIYGNSGLGKTHLLNAIKYEISKNFPNMTIMYTRGEDFCNEFVSHLQNKSTEDFHNKYRSIDLLLVDDIQFIGGKVAIQEEFFHTFDALVSQGKQVCLTSDRPPKDIQTLDDRLRSRFECGLIADMNIPDLETRIAIIRRKAEILNFNIPDDVVTFIAERIKSNVRQLEGTVKKLYAKSSIEGHTPSLMLTQSIIKDVLNDSQPVPVTIRRIVDEVSRTYNVPVEKIYSDTRKANVHNARKVALYIIREVTGLSFENIGEEFNRDHSTVMHAINKVEEEMSVNSVLSANINDIIKNIKEN